MAKEKPTFLQRAEQALDRAIMVVSPQAGFRRLEARAALTYFGYDAANPGALRGPSGGLYKNAAAESPKMQLDTVKVMWDARDASRNNTLLGGVLRRTVRYCVPKISYQSRTGDRKTDQVYEDFFHDWCTRCDITGRHTLRKLARMSLYSMMRDGDFGFVKCRVGKELRLQSIEADRIGNVLEAGATLMNEHYIRGITIDDSGVPQSYRIYRRNRIGIQYIFDREVPASQFIHLADPDETDKYRPVSWLQPALADARDLNEIWGFVKQRCKFSSMWSGFLTSKDPYQKTSTGTVNWDNPEDKAAGQPASMNAAPGKVIDLTRANMDIQFPPAMNEPAGAFMNLFETGIRKIAVALDLPYGFVWDMAVFGGVTARIETMSADRLFGDKRQLLTDLVLNQVKNDVLALGISYREIPPHPNFRSGKFLFGARLTADVGHETAALVQAIDTGFTTKTRVMEEWYDEDFDEVTETQASETQHRQEVAAATGVPIELLDKSQPNATQLLAAINTPPAPPPQPPPGMVGEQGDKGVQPLLDILGQVGKGELDRESAIYTIMELYGKSYADVEPMVPEPKSLPALKDAGSAADSRRGFGRMSRKVAIRGDVE
jgi:capsid protein